MRQSGSTLGQLATLVGTTMLGDRAVALGDVVVRDVVVNADDVTPGDLFVAVRRGGRSASEVLQAVVSQGAAAVCADRPINGLAIPQLVVDNPWSALAVLAAEVHGHPSKHLDVVGVTGTDGKTTVTFLLESIVDAAGGRPARAGTIGVHLAGRPLPSPPNPTAADFQRLLGHLADAQATMLAVEATSVAAAARQIDETHFAVMAFTNLGRDHLDLHGTIDNYFEAKASLFLENESRHKVVMIDDDHGRLLAKRVGTTNCVTVSRRGPADVWASDLRFGPRGVAFELRGIGGDPLHVRLPLHGEHNVANAVVAAASASALGVSADAIVLGLESAPTPPGRLEPVRSEPGEATVFVDYAHTPQGVRAAIAAAQQIADNKVIAVLGAGGDRDPGKRPLLGHEAALADTAIITSDNPRSEDPSVIAAEIASGAAHGRAEVHVVPDRSDAIELGVRFAGPGDVLLILGKGHERTQESGATVHPFDDRAVATAALERNRYA